MSEGIKRMLAERAAIAAKSGGFLQIDVQERQRADDERSGHPSAMDALMARIDLAAPYIDEHHVEGWRPSSRLAILVCIVATLPRKGARTWAFMFADRMLEVARERFKAGLDPNPWLASKEDLRRVGRGL